MCGDVTYGPVFHKGILQCNRQPRVVLKSSVGSWGKSTEKLNSREQRYQQVGFLVI